MLLIVTGRLVTHRSEAKASTTGYRPTLKQIFGTVGGGEGCNSVSRAGLRHRVLKHDQGRKCHTAKKNSSILFFCFQILVEKGSKSDDY